jgi:hypothetical protein
MLGFLISKPHDRGTPLGKFLNLCALLTISGIRLLHAVNGRQCNGERAISAFSVRKGLGVAATKCVLEIFADLAHDHTRQF